MDTQTLIIVLIAVAVLVVGVIASFANRAKRSKELRQKFGPEYDYAIKKEGDQRVAEETLLEREKRVNTLDIRSLEDAEMARYQAEWAEIQANFVDKPFESVRDANRLIIEVMVARGFPVADFEQRAADISVLYPDFVSNYRNAYAIAMKSQQGAVSTEELRQAMVHYHSLFDVLLETKETEKMEATIS